MSRISALCAALAVLAAALATAAPASATTYPVSGKQVVVNEAKGKFALKGGLVGKWTTTSFKATATSPIYEAKGTEKFQGCLDRERDGKCAGDPSGTLSFRFLYWGMFEPGDSLVWGSCWHPITGGTGDFAHAEGVLTMVDTPNAKGVTTRYTGNITLVSTPAARMASAVSVTTAAARPVCG